MATTTPDSIVYPVGTDPVAPLQTIFASLATSVQTALSRRARTSYVWANAAARTAQTGMIAGSTGYQVDTKFDYTYDGTSWVANNKTVGGTFYNTVAADGTTAVAHGLGVTPNWVQITMRNHPTTDVNSRLWDVKVWGDPNSNTFNVRAIDRRDNNWTSNQSLRFFWTAGV